jgi:hypothetical protein
MSRARLYPDEFFHKRRLAWLRSRCQAHYRGEDWQLSFEEFCDIWSSPELFEQRGRKRNCLVLIRMNPLLAWSRANCCIVSRTQQIKIKIALKHNQDWSKHLIIIKE